MIALLRTPDRVPAMPRNSVRESVYHKAPGGNKTEELPRGGAILLGAI